MSVSFGFFPYEAMNYKAAQAYLDRKAEKGLALKHIYLGAIARFEEAESPRHFVDLDLMRSDFDGTDEAYLQLCEDAGWQPIQELRGMLLFRALPGRDPLPIQSDREMEWDRFWKKYARKNLITSALVTLAAVGLLALVLRLPSSGTGRSLAAGVASNSSLLYLLAFGLALLSLLLSLVGIPLYLFRCRRSGQAEPPNRVWARLQDTPFRLYTPLYLLAACIAMAEIFGAGKTVDLNWSPMYEGNTATVEACREYPVLLADDLDTETVERAISLLLGAIGLRRRGRGLLRPHHRALRLRRDCSGPVGAGYPAGGDPKRFLPLGGSGLGTHGPFRL